MSNGTRLQLDSLLVMDMIFHNVYIDFHENKIMESINHAFGAYHSHVQPKDFHFAKFPLGTNIQNWKDNIIVYNAKN